MPNQFTGRTIRPVFIPIGPSIAYVALPRGRFALIDSADALRVGEHNWYAHLSGVDTLYARRNRPKVGGGYTPESLHQFILGEFPGYTVDHVHPGNGLDCRRSNLRFATWTQQAINRRISHRNTSGHKGVSFNTGLGKWAAYIKTQKKVHLGYFSTLEEAVAARTTAARAAYGDFYHV